MEVLTLDALRKDSKKQSLCGKVNQSEFVLNWVFDEIVQPVRVISRIFHSYSQTNKRFFAYSGI
jgi:hypothetical protein